MDVLANRVEISHPYYVEMLQFQLMLYSQQAVAFHQQCLIYIRELSNAIERIVEWDGKAVDPRKGFPGVWVVAPQIRPQLQLQSPGCPEDCRIEVDDEFPRYMLSPNKPPNSFFFELCPASPMPPRDEGDVKISGEQPTRLLMATFCYLLGGAFESKSDHFATRYGKRQNWPPKLQFFRHIRNGCFHGNRFRIDKRNGRDQIDPANPPSWHTLVMPTDSAMNGREVIGPNGFLPLPYILPFLYDMGQLV